MALQVPLSSTPAHRQSNPRKFRTPKRMDLLPHSKIMQRQKWAYYTLSMVGSLLLDILMDILIQRCGYSGAGALVSPLVATQFAQVHRWSFHYLCSLGIACANTVFLIAVFRFKTQDGKTWSVPTFVLRHVVPECLEQIGQAAGEKGTSEDNKFRQIFRLKTVHLLAFFILVYVGVEVTIGGQLTHVLVPIICATLLGYAGWIVTFIIRIRGGGPSSGYISAGFFGGKYDFPVLLIFCTQNMKV